MMIVRPRTGRHLVKYLINLHSQHKLTILSQSISLKFELTLRLELNLRIIYELIIQPQERLSNMRKTPKVNVT